MSARQYAERQSWRIVPETCPKVDAALSLAAEAIKEQTGALREALVDALMDCQEKDGEIADLNKEVNRLSNRVSELESELSTKEQP